MSRLFKGWVLASLLFEADALWACAVCFGNPESSLSKGALAGVLILLGVVVIVLGGITGMALFWMKRARNLASEKQTQEMVSVMGRLGVSPPVVNGHVATAHPEL